MKLSDDMSPEQWLAAREAEVSKLRQPKAQFRSLGRRRGGRGVHGGASYTALAVHFGGSTVLHIASLTATDNALISYVGWFKCAHADVSSLTLYVSDPTGNYLAYNLGAQGADAAHDKIDFQACDAAGAKTLDASCPQGSFPGDQWNCVIATLDASDGSGVVYNGNTNTGTVPLATGGAFTNAFNGLSFYIGGDDSGFATADFADIRIMPGVDLRTAGDISVATRRLFVGANGKPVNPATATASLGASCMLFSGDATGFATNQGTGGTFTLTGSLTNAATSPSD